MSLLLEQKPREAENEEKAQKQWTKVRSHDQESMELPRCREITSQTRHVGLFRCLSPSELEGLTCVERRCPMEVTWNNEMHKALLTRIFGQAD